ncbi:hypothetical protein BpHYR1_035448 [Brachionus plicatilis]|uniref:Uncharacterized protein n=1 Tax=Brachionus plicatilis TaxID=10195 RepID=A0A3M7SS29_BRAPC|nr:hypothetical protein BpHYR1_035448 [Brachionus plicatilis]
MIKIKQILYLLSDNLVQNLCKLYVKFAEYFPEKTRLVLLWNLIIKCLAYSIGYLKKSCQHESSKVSVFYEPIN